MGCATSKPKVCKNCKGGVSSPVRRSYSLHAYIPAEMDEHMVALTSSTLGSMRLDLLDHQRYLEEKCQDLVLLKKEEFAMGVVEARSWSKMIDERIPKIVPRTPITTPPGEPETIDAWELMAGLEDTSPLNLKRPPPFNHIRSFSFHLGAGNFAADEHPTPRVNQEDPKSEKSRKPLWLTMAEDESPVSIEPEFDPEVISSFRKSLEELPQASPFHLKPPAGEEKDAPPSETSPPEKEVPSSETLPPLPPRGKERLIVYFTSLRGVRKTYEDCCSVRVILKGLGVKVDERDVSMHSGFKDELKELLGEGWFISKGGLPKVFIGNKFLGGVEEIKRLNEEGRLEKAVEGCETMEDGGGTVAGASCEACGDVRFVPCETCSGSCKIYCEGEYRDEDEDDDEDEEDLEGEFGFQRCPDCNENGLTRCPLCCDY